MSKLSLRPALTLLSAVAVALAIATSAVAQAPPSTPHQFFGSEPTGSGALLDGAPAPDGAVVTAWNEDGVALEADTIAEGVWTLQIEPADASSVVFTINDSLPSASFEVRAAAFEEIRLDLSSPSGEDAPADVADDATPDDTADYAAEDDAAADDTDDAPAAAAESFGMPVTGSGGLAGGGSRLPVLSLIFAISALVGMGGVMAVRRIRA